MMESLATPQTVDAAVDWLLLYLEAEDIAGLAAHDEDELIEYHFGLGLLTRDAFSLWDNPPLLAATGAAHPDDAALVILKAAWRRLNPLH